MPHIHAADIAKAIPAALIEPGHCFRKIGGEYVYLRMRPTPMLQPVPSAGDVFGVCFNGGVTRVSANKRVVPVPISDMLGNVEGEQAWERNICGREPDPER